MAKKTPSQPTQPSGDLAAELKAIKAELKATREAKASLEKTLGELQIARLRATPLSAAEVARLRAKDGATKLVVLDDAKIAGTSIPRGRVFEIRHYPMIESWVRAGLRLVRAE